MPFCDESARPRLEVIRIATHAAPWGGVSTLLRTTHKGRSNMRKRIAVVLGTVAASLPYVSSANAQTVVTQPADPAPTVVTPPPQTVVTPPPAAVVAPPPAQPQTIVVAP